LKINQNRIQHLQVAFELRKKIHNEGQLGFKENVDMEKQRFISLS
jgi:sensor domain CHASE-containing protein